MTGHPMDRWESVLGDITRERKRQSGLWDGPHTVQGWLWRLSAQTGSLSGEALPYPDAAPAECPGARKLRLYQRAVAVAAAAAGLAREIAASSREPESPGDR